MSGSDTSILVMVKSSVLLDLSLTLHYRLILPFWGRWPERPEGATPLLSLKLDFVEKLLPTLPALT